MIDRGLRRGVRSGGRARGARGARRASIEMSARRDLRSLPTFTIDPASARDFDDAISASVDDDGGWRVWVHIADVSAYVAPRSLVDREAYRRGTSVYVPGAVEPMLPGQLSNNACSLVPGVDRATVTVEMVVREQSVQRAAFYRSVIRSDERLELRRRSIGSSTGARRPRRRGETRSRRRERRPPRSRHAGRRAAALVVESEEPSFAFDRARERRRRRAGGADGVAPADRAPDDRRQRAGRGAARGAPRADAVPRARAARRAGGGAADRAACVARRADAAGAARAHDATAGRRRGRGGLAARRRVGAAHGGRGRRALVEPGAALAQAGLLRPPEPRPRRAPVPALLPLHLADPPLSRT